MSGMTKDQLTAHIKDIVAPMLKTALGGEGNDIADVIRLQIENAVKAASTASAPAWAGKMFAEDPAQSEKAAREERSLAWASCLRAVAAAKMSGQGPDAAISILSKWGRKDVAEKWADARAKALAAGDATGGGFLVPTQFSSDLIEFLRPAAVVRSLNPTTMPMPVGSMKVPKVTTGTEASYIGENSNAPRTEPEFGQITLTFKKLAALVPISNDLIRYSSPNADTVVRNDLVAALAAREDKAFIRDNGTSATPKGLKYWINPVNRIDVSGAASLASVTTDLGRLMQCLMAANIPLVMQQNLEGANLARPGWIFSPRVWRYLTTLQTTTGAYAFRDEMLRGTLWGFPYRVTTQVLETMSDTGADTGGTKTEVYFGAFAHAIIGEALGMTVDASTDAAYHDGSNVVAAFSQDQTVIRVIEEHDFALRHDKSFALLEKVAWGI